MRHSLTIAVRESADLRSRLPASLVVPGHPDFAVLTAVATDPEARAGGPGRLALDVPALLREVIDDVIQTPRTGRRSIDELDKTEKTYIGTRVEIMLRSLLGLPRGRLDAVVLGRDTDIKFTMGDNWMIPSEAVGHACILIAADEVRARCFLGLFVARPEHLTAKGNRDGKKTLSAAGIAHVLWVFRDHPYPANFWRTVAPDAVDRIFSGKDGNARVMALFREAQGVAVSRSTVEGVARQSDFMRRIRSDKGRGARDRLETEGILLLSGAYDGPLIRALGLPMGDFVSYRIKGETDRSLARASGWKVWTIRTPQSERERLVGQKPRVLREPADGGAVFPAAPGGSVGSQACGAASRGSFPPCPPPAPPLNEQRRRRG